MLEQILMQVFRSLVAVANSKGAEGIAEIFGALRREGASNDELAGLEADLVAERLRRVAEHSPDGTLSNESLMNALNEERQTAFERMRADQAKSQTKSQETAAHGKPDGGNQALSGAGLVPGNTGGADAGKAPGNAAADHGQADPNAGNQGRQS